MRQYFHIKKDIDEEVSVFTGVPYSKVREATDFIVKYIKGLERNTMAYSVRLPYIGDLYYSYWKGYDYWRYLGRKRKTPMIYRNALYKRNKTLKHWILPKFKQESSCEDEECYKVFLHTRTQPGYIYPKEHYLKIDKLMEKIYNNEK